MSDARSVLDEMQISQAEHLPLVAAFLERMRLATVVNAAVPSQMAVDLGREVSAGAFNDTTLGRALDAIYEHGTEQLFSQVALAAAASFPAELDLAHSTQAEHPFRSSRTPWSEATCLLF